MAMIGGGRPVLGSFIRGACTLWGIVVWVVCFVGPGWGSPADLSLYLDFEEVEPWRQVQWSDSIQHWSVADRSPYGQRWLLSVSQGLASAFVPLGPVALEAVVGVHGQAIKIAGSVSVGSSLAVEGLRRNGISVPVWHRRIGDWLFAPLHVRSEGNADLLYAAVGQTEVPVWRMGESHSRGWGASAVPDFEVLGQATEEDRWVHYAATYDPGLGLARLYTDGEVVGEAPSSAPLPEDWRSGIHWLADPYMRAEWMMLDDLSIWKRALTEEDIRAVMEGGPLALPTAVTARVNAATTWASLRLPVESTR